MGVGTPRQLRDVHPTRRGLILAWFAFAVTFGVLIDLKDVYWSAAGGVNIAVALVLIAVAGGLLALTRAPGMGDKVSQSEPEAAER